MTKFDKVIDSLRVCSDQEKEDCTGCMYADSSSCSCDLMVNAADAIEELLCVIKRLCAFEDLFKDYVYRG